MGRVVHFAPHTAKPRKARGPITIREIEELPQGERHHAIMLYISQLDREIDEATSQAEIAIARMKGVRARAKQKLVALKKKLRRKKK